MIGETLGEKYIVASLLGRGGMGSVYEAEHVETKERVALKVLHENLADGEAAARFHREADAAKALRSEHVVRVLESGVDVRTGRHYLASELLVGEDLQRLLDRSGALEPEAALRIAAHALRGLAAAHSAGIVHRDIKPANLFLSREPSGDIFVKVLDFGVAKLLDGFGAGAGGDARGLTTTRGFLGSPLYMSPEQIRSSRNVDHRTDLWSLGCVLYAMLAGRSPFEHYTTVGELLVGVSITPAISIGEVAPWVDREKVALVDRALTLPIEGRYPSARSMLAAIESLVASTSLTEDAIVPVGKEARPIAISTPPPSPATPFRVVVTGENERIPRGDAPTEHSPIPSSRPPIDDTVPSEGAIQRSGVPRVGASSGVNCITVDARPLVGDKCELWQFSLDVHQHVSGVIGRVWKGLRRAGSNVRPMSYGVEWVLVERRTGRRIDEFQPGTLERMTLEAAGIRAGMILTVESC